MERMTAYGWYLFYVSSLLVVMRWVIQSIGLAAPPSPSVAGQVPQGIDVHAQSPKSRAVGSGESCPEVSKDPTVRRVDERAAGRVRMVEAWASRCRLLSVDKETDIQSAARQLLSATSKGLLVVDGRTGEIVGVLQERDLVRALGEHGAHLGRMRVGELVDTSR